MNCVLIGRGYWGKILEKYINQSKYFDLVGVYTRSTSALSYEEFLKSVVVDAVFICSPVSSHYEHVKYALLQGKHVFCEKPFANNVAESDELYELAREKNLCLYVDYIYACSPSIIKLVDIMPRIGEVQKVEFEMTQMGKFYADCDVLGNIGVHMLTAMGVVLGVDGYISELDAEHLYVSQAGMKLDSLYRFKYKGIPVSMKISIVSLEKMRKITVFGKNGIVKFDMMADKTIQCVLFNLDTNGVKNAQYLEDSFDETNNLTTAVEKFYSSIISSNFDNIELSRFVERTRDQMKSK